MKRWSRVIPPADALIWYGVVERAPFPAAFHLIVVILATGVFGVFAAWSAATQGYEAKTVTGVRYLTEDKAHWYDQIVPSAWARDDVCEPNPYSPGDLIYTSSGWYAWAVGSDNLGFAYKGDRIEDCEVDYLDIVWNFGEFTLAYEVGVECWLPEHVTFVHNNLIEREATIRLPWNSSIEWRSDGIGEIELDNWWDADPLLTMINKVAQHLYGNWPVGASAPARERMRVRARVERDQDVWNDENTGYPLINSTTTPLGIVAISVGLSNEVVYDAAALQALADRNMTWFVPVLQNSVHILAGVLGSDFWMTAPGGWAPIGEEMFELGFNRSWQQPTIEVNGTMVPIYDPAQSLLVTQQGCPGGQGSIRSCEPDQRGLHDLHLSTVSREEASCLHRLRCRKHLRPLYCYVGDVDERIGHLHQCADAEDSRSWAATAIHPA